MPELLRHQTNEVVEDTEKPAEVSEVEQQPYSAPTLRKLGGGLVKVTLGSVTWGTPDENSQFRG